jgi:hypothetical protein
MSMERTGIPLFNARFFLIIDFTDLGKRYLPMGQVNFSCFSCCYSMTNSNSEAQQTQQTQISEITNFFVDAGPAPIIFSTLLENLKVLTSKCQVITESGQAEEWRNTNRTSMQWEGLQKDGFEQSSGLCIQQMWR